MNDMSSVIVPKSDQINADDLISGPMDITIRDVAIRGGQEQPVSIFFEGSDKAFRPCKSMSRVLVQGWGPDASKYVGRSLRLYRDPTVKWAGMEVGGIRISHMSHIDGEKLMMLTATKGSRKPHKVFPLQVEQKADKAAEWTAKHLAEIEAASDDALPGLIEKRSENVAKLKEARPELHSQIAEAYSKRSVVDVQDDDPFADDDDGEDEDGADETPSEQRLAKFREQIAAAKNLKGLVAVDGEWVKHRGAFDDETAGEIDALIAERRKALS